MESGESISTHRSFEEQLHHIQKIETTAGITELVDIKPAEEKHRPVLVMPGTGGSPASYQRLLRLAYEGGFRTLFSLPERSNKIMQDETKYNRAELRKVVAAIDAVKQADVDEFDLICHSESSLQGVILAELYPGVRNLVVVNPAGLIGKDTHARLALGLAKMVGEFTLRTLPGRQNFYLGVETVKDTLEYVARNPRQLGREFLAVRASDIADVLQPIHENGHGIIVVQSLNDPVFPIDKMIEELQQRRHAIDAFISYTGGHNELNLDDRHARLVLEALINLEVKQARIDNLRGDDSLQA